MIWLPAGLLLLIFAVVALLGAAGVRLPSFRRTPVALHLQAEAEAMQTAARIRETANAAEDHMDVFLRERRSDGHNL
ncbi:hypothetical protein G3I59_31195 [Amycolatopsis rubida]|uniref:Uncharacterized protein n=1 Tax=Amycolatopsis rubida TaxID=112413 RepID=A0ABX0BYD3_9PSEU|nr:MULTISPECIES: hypothetical protein [Amycolatopsis]MYW94946.1 hypothetical protein [Amycolatopsis rubida]NEC59933.1 hypothetical protein [Amycolatopsis rubida]OAP25670.1 hypothetical protein A4R44_03044 [Amycolatopsis sp. M39]